MLVTAAYVAEERRKAFGNTVYRCPTCGFQAWGRPVTAHEMLTTHDAMIALERLIGQDVDTTPHAVKKRDRRSEELAK